MERNNLIKVFLGVIIILSIWFFWEREEWTLMVCKEKFDEAQCDTNSYVIAGFESSKECLLEGASKFAKEGFECGKNCKENDYGLKVCEEICNSAGCRK